MAYTVIHNRPDGRRYTLSMYASGYVDVLVYDRDGFFEEHTYQLADLTQARLQFALLDLVLRYGTEPLPLVRWIGR